MKNMGYLAAFAAISSVISEDFSKFFPEFRKFSELFDDFLDFQSRTYCDKLRTFVEFLSSSKIFQMLC